MTGGSGFLGQVFVKKLLALGHHVEAPLSSECNLWAAESLDYYNDKPVDVILHLAAWTQAGDFCLRHPGEQWINNQLINTNVLNWWVKNHPSAKLVFMGTSCAYAESSELVEKNYMAGEPTQSLYTYAMTKRMLFQGARSLGEQFDLDWIGIVPSTLYGPNYHLDGRQMHFIFDLIKKILRGKFLGEPVVLWGDGYQRRELIHVSSFVDLSLDITQKCNRELVNLGAGEDYSIRDFANKICRIIGYDRNLIRYDTTKYVGARSKVLDVNKAKTILDSYDKRLIDLDAGLQSTIQWFKDNKVYLN